MTDELANFLASLERNSESQNQHLSEVGDISVRLMFIQGTVQITNTNLDFQQRSVAGDFIMGVNTMGTLIGASSTTSWATLEKSGEVWRDTADFDKGVTSGVSTASGVIRLA